MTLSCTIDRVVPPICKSTTRSYFCATVDQKFFVREPCVSFLTRSVKSERERAKIIEVFAFEPTVACALIKPTCALILNGYIGIWVNTLLKIGIRQTVSQD